MSLRGQWIALCLLGLIAMQAAVAIAHGDHGHDHDHDEDDESESSHSEVVSLTPSDFDQFVSDNEISLIEFFAPWCGHCKALAPEYDAASIELSGKAKLAKVDCTEHRELCSRYEVQGFPTIKLFRSDGSQPADYDQPRTSAAIVKFMLKQKQPAWTVLTSAAEITEASNKDPLSVIAYINANDQASTDVFVSVARALRNDYEFFLVSNAGLVGSGAPRVVVHRKFDEPVVTYDGAFNSDDISSFIKTNAFPAVGEIGPENYQKYVERGLPLAWFFLHKENDQAVLAMAREVAPAFRSSVSVVWLDGVRWADHGKTFGLNGNTPGIVIENRSQRKNYVFPQGSDETPATPVTAQNLRTWLQSFADGSLAPTLKSEPIPESNDGPVKIVVGKTFEQIVMDDSKDVLVEFYAPWCGHCKTLAPKYEKLGETFKGHDSVVIAKVDATENDTPADIKGFPTLILYPAGSKSSPITYSGDRTDQAMAKWIRENAASLKKKGAKPAAGGKKGHEHDEL